MEVTQSRRVSLFNFDNVLQHVKSAMCNSKQQSFYNFSYVSFKRTFSLTVGRLTFTSSFRGVSTWITATPLSCRSPQRLPQSPCWTLAEESRRRRGVQAAGTSLQQLSRGRGEKWSKGERKWRGGWGRRLMCEEGRKQIRWNGEGARKYEGKPHWVWRDEKRSFSLQKELMEI